MSKAKPVSTPLVNHFKISLEQCQKTDSKIEDMSKNPYSNAVGVSSMLWFALDWIWHKRLVKCASSCPSLGSRQVDSKVLEGYNKSWYHVHQGARCSINCGICGF